MYDLSDIGPTTKEMAAIIIAVFIVLVLIFGAGYLLGINSAREDLYDNGNGAAGVGNQITEAGTNIQHAKDGIEAAAGTVDRIGAGISQAKESTGYIQHTADSSAELIAECQSIIRQIRQRGKTDTAAN
ncbi:MAG: hypothetical protein IKZ43_07290 [Acidaminococcaceae bacterium]|nr:hypothetical protein [Acidaminococcaceae bacterium]